MGKPNPYTFNHAAIAICHNHIHGSAHCIECAGPCKLLEQTAQALTCIARSLVECAELGEQISWRVKRAFKNHGIDLDAMAKAPLPEVASR